jgi:transcription antitermination factor NusA-like protein
VIIAWEMVVNNEDLKTLIKAKMETNIKRKRQMKLNNFKVVKDLRVFVNVILKQKFKKCRLIAKSPHPNCS